jgi:hypothetical protein
MHNIFIVKSPLQLMNAIEAKEHFKTENNLLVLMNANATNDKQMQTVLALSKWDEIITYAPTNRSSTLLAQVNLIRSLKKHRYHYLFTGDYGTFNQVLMANLTVDDYYLVDDGTKSIEIHKALRDPSKITLSKKLKLLRYTLFGLKSSITKPINFFTCYNLTPIKDEQIVANDYAYLQSIFTPQEQKEQVIYLLGQNIDNKWMKEGTYIEYLKRIKSHYTDKIIYIPHRHEVISDELKALFDEDFVLQYNDIPIEIYFLEKKIYPKQIVSFTSSALFNLEKIYAKAQIDAIVIHQKDLIKMHGFVKSCYQFFDELGIRD